MFHYLKANVWMIEYRGYGDSDDARPNESGLKLDAEAVWEYANNKSLLPNADPKRMFVFGQSLGGAVAFHLAQYSQSTSYPPLAGVILENTFLSISEMVDHLMPYVAPLKMLILRMYWNSGKIAPIIRIPTLFLAGARDTLVPHSHMLTLFDRMKSSKVKTLVRLHVVKDGTHNETWMQGGREYWMAIQRFFDEVFAAENSSGASYARSASAAASVRGDGPLFQRKASVAKGGIAAAASSASGECADCSDRKESVAVDLGGEDAAEMISSVGNFIGMAREATRTVGGSKGVGGAVAYKKKD
jgi:pimeloyl-ACP methyl ester carboxylesterase